jgi:hypothetical protein
VSAGEEAEHPNGVQAHQHADHQDEDEAQEGRRAGPMLGQPRRCDELSGLQLSARDDDGPEGAGKDRGQASMEKAADTQASANAATKAA